MFKQEVSYYIWGGHAGKYQLKGPDGEELEKTPEETASRVSRALADVETDKAKSDLWYERFNSICGRTFAGGGRIMANAGAGHVKKEVSAINCTVMRQIPDSMSGIMETAKEAAIALKFGCGVGYDFSPIRPKGAYIFGAGAETSGVISFMGIFDAICGTVQSGGGRRGAQMGVLDVQHPEIESFITAKQNDGVLRNFNLSVLVTDDFMNAVINDDTWDLWHWTKMNEPSEFDNTCKVIQKDDIPYNYPKFEFFGFSSDHAEVLAGNCEPIVLDDDGIYVSGDVFQKHVFKTIHATSLFDTIMKSTFDYSEPGLIFIDRINNENNLRFAEVIRATNPCGEQPLPPDAACLLGSMILPAFIRKMFKKTAHFDFDMFREHVQIASRMLDNVVDINNLPIDRMRKQIEAKRRHGLGVTGVGSMLNMLGISYGSQESIELVTEIARVLAQETLLANIEIAKEKGCAPIFESAASRRSVIESKYMKRLLDSFGEQRTQLVADILAHGLRWSHGTSIAPTGTMSMTWGNNCSNGIEPVIGNAMLRNVIEPGKKTKVQLETYDLAYFEWKNQNGDKELPEHWTTTDDLTVHDHINIQAAMQPWVDSSISKTINIPTEFSFDDFKDVYKEGWLSGLKGMTTFRFNPAVFSGVIVKNDDLESTEYSFILEDGQEVVLKGNDKVFYDGEEHIASNLFDALKEGLYDRW